MDWSKMAETLLRTIYVLVKNEEAETKRLSFQISVDGVISAFLGVQQTLWTEPILLCYWTMSCRKLRMFYNVDVLI